MADTLEEMPVVVTEPGTYLLRGGGYARIDNIANDSNGTFKCHGGIYRMFREKFMPRGFQIWHVSGCFLAVGESKFDIIAPFGEVPIPPPTAR